jgi:hypothetical protein
MLRSMLLQPSATRFRLAGEQAAAATSRQQRFHATKPESDHKQL